MGFLLWIAGDVAWAQGAYESRAMGSAVISVTDLFQHRDFRSSRRPPSVFDPAYVGWFASLSDVNARLRSSTARLSSTARRPSPSPRPASGSRPARGA